MTETQKQNGNSKGYKTSPVLALKRKDTPATTFLSKEIDENGGDLHLSSAGLKITIPKGAVSQKTKFEVHAHRSVFGFVVNMEPLATLAVPAEVEQHLHADALQEPLLLCGSNMVDDETICYEYHKMQLNGHKATGQLTHFSGHIIACGLEMIPCNPEQDGPECVWVD